jgi:hypothetical protein
MPKFRNVSSKSPSQHLRGSGNHIKFDVSQRFTGPIAGSYRVCRFLRPEMEFGSEKLRKTLGNETTCKCVPPTVQRRPDQGEDDNPPQALLVLELQGGFKEDSRPGFEL